ncbi:filamentous hemagglutinin family N-terminal domain [Helicobacter pullorum]|uniref:filamentous hemagglutinin N-terminal domain-containing protein n=1 Tax=Helicobacter pullorum TaxID=35818 RepID=UPI000F6B9C70|nr:filamentous hemagglutinin N-terminal domain-containing protein [Helicobacter pullorum]VEJ07809.1 filamentous hemagglutinin family N-terminal domain [Helicobacter pullorum]
MGGGGANKPLINSLNTLNTLKNSNPKELAKNLNKIQNSNQLDLNHLNELKDSRLDLIQLESKIQDTKNLNQLKESKNLNKIQEINLSKESKNLNKIQMKSSKTALGKISISIIASVLLSQNLAALPAGGKFTHGSGSIKVNGKVMNITGNNINHIIAWGGGFNINKGESVNFLGNNKSYLNLDYTNKASQILGNLNGNGNNIYLVNPSGVLIGKDASINANKFVASNTIDNTTLNNFKTQTKLVESFSPVFQPNKGNIVNLGSIRAKEIVLIGNEVRNQAIIKENGKETIITGSFSGYDDKNPNSKTKNDSITLVGNIVDININTGMIDTKQVWIAAKDKARINQSTSDIYFNGNRLVGNNALKTSNDLNASNIEWIAYNGITNPKSIETYASIANLEDWAYFAMGWNEVGSSNQYESIQNVKNYELINDIDFMANCQNGVCTGQNYADFNFTKLGIDIGRDGNTQNDRVSMIVGEAKMYEGKYSGRFNGNGHTLKNINIEVTNPDVGVAGIFGSTSHYSEGYVSFENLIVDYQGGSIKSSGNSGGLLGDSYYNQKGVFFNNIKIKNINEISGNAAGGFIGSFDSGKYFLESLSNISVSNINKIIGLEAGGFAGSFLTNLTKEGVINNVYINNIGMIEGKLRAGGFIGSYTEHYWTGFNLYDKIVIGNIDSIKGEVAGGIFGDASLGANDRYCSGSGCVQENGVEDGLVIAYNIKSIQGSKVDGLFAGYLSQIATASGQQARDSIIDNIYMFFDNKNYNNLPNSFAEVKIFEDSLPYDSHFIKGSNVHIYLTDTAKMKEINFSSGGHGFGVENKPFLSEKLNNFEEFQEIVKEKMDISTPTPPNINDSTTNTLPTLDMDNLFNKGGYFDSSSWLTKDDFNQSILNEILENLSFDILSLITDTNSLESALQSLDFLLHFINADKSGESGISLGNGIYGLMGYALNQSQIDLLNSNNLLITQKLISSINSLSLEDKHYIQEYKQKLESYQAKAKEFEESLKVISSDKHQALIEAFKQENGYYSLLDDRDRAEKIIKTAINNNGEFNLNNPYKIANGINVSFNLNTIEGINDKDGLNPDFTLPSANSSLFVKEDIEDVLILPVQEKQEAIVEDGKERGRLCIVSDNAKTNNPCMAITY